MYNPSSVNTPDILDLWAMFPRWCNAHHAGDGEHRFAALDMDTRSGDTLTLVGEMSGRDGLIATYKCNVAVVRDLRKSWLVFSPLVVMWAPGRVRGADLGRIMMEHIVAAITDFHYAHGDPRYGVLIASGNLTVAKGGGPFFEKLGWEIVFPLVREPLPLFYGEDAMRAPLDAVAAQIEAALAPLRDAGELESEPISFAMLRLS